MTDYKKLVKALRCKRDDCEGCDLAFLDKDEGWMCQYAAKDDDAADAIEKLVTLYEKAEIDATNLTGKLAQAEAQLPKLGEIVRCKDCKWSISCGYISTRSYAKWKDWFCADGEKMEVQE